MTVIIVDTYLHTETTGYFSTTASAKPTLHVTTYSTAGIIIIIIMSFDLVILQLYTVRSAFRSVLCRMVPNRDDGSNLMFLYTKCI